MSNASRILGKGEMIINERAVTSEAHLKGIKGIGLFQCSVGAVRVPMSQLHCSKTRIETHRSKSASVPTHNEWPIGLLGDEIHSNSHPTHFHHNHWCSNSANLSSKLLLHTRQRIPTATHTITQCNRYLLLHRYLLRSVSKSNTFTHRSDARHSQAAVDTVLECVGGQLQCISLAIPMPLMNSEKTHPLALWLRS